MPDDPEDPNEEDGPPGDRHGRLVPSEPIEGEQDQGRQGQAENEDDYRTSSADLRPSPAPAPVGWRHTAAPVAATTRQAPHPQAGVW